MGIKNVVFPYYSKALKTQECLRELREVRAVSKDLDVSIRNAANTLELREVLLNELRARLDRPNLG